MVNLASSCVVVIAGATSSSGFFVSSTCVATCAHTVHPMGLGDTVRVRYKGRNYDGMVIWKEPSNAAFVLGDALPQPDVSLIRVVGADGTPLRIVNHNPEPNEMLLSYGFPEGGEPHGEPLTMNFVGQAFGEDTKTGSFFKVKGARIFGGQSGSPVVLADGTAIGILTASDNLFRVEGGFVAPTWFFENALNKFVEGYIVQSVPLASEPTSFIPDGAPTTFRPGDAPIVYRAKSKSLGFAVSEFRDKTSASEVPVSSAGMPKFVSPTAVPESDADVALLDEVEGYRNRGLFKTAISLVKGFAAAQAFGVQASSVQARALRLQAALTIDCSGDLDVAETLANRARLLEGDVPKQRILDSLIIARRHDAATALETLLGEERDVQLQRAGYYLEAGDPAACIKTIVGHGLTADDDAKAARLLARSYVLLRDRDAAFYYANRTLEIAPDNVWGMITAADVLLLRAIATSFWPRTPGWFVQPYPPSITLSTEHARSDLARSRDITQRLLAVIEVDGKDADLLKITLLAGLVFDSERRAEASEYAERLLYGSDRIYSVIQWVRGCGLDVDVEPAFGMMRISEKNDGLDSEGVLLLVSECMQRGLGAEAESLLRRREDLFAEPRHHAAWAFHLIESVADQDRFDDAVAESEKLFDGDELTRVRLVVESMKASRTKDFAPFKALLESHYAVTGDEHDLFVLIEIAADESRWADIVERAPAVLSGQSSPKVQRLVLYAFYNTGHDQEFVSLAESLELQGYIPDADVRRMRALSLARLGSERGEEELKALVNQFPTEENVFALGRLQAHQGDYAALELTARYLSRMSDVSPKVALFFSSWLRLRDRAGAQGLWRRAKTSGVPDELVSLAFTLGMQLGLESEIEDLSADMQRIGERGEHGVRLVSVTDGLQSLREAAKQTTDLSRRYKRGELPIHFLCANTNIDLVQTHVETPRMNSVRGPKAWVPIYVRHGSRADTERLPGTPVLDATTYLLLETLGMMEAVLAAFSCVLVPDVLPTVIAMAVDSRREQQPAHTQSLRGVVGRVDRGELRLLEVAEAGSFVVEWPDIDLKEVGGRLTPRDLVEAMFAEGLVSAAKYAAAMTASSFRDDTGPRSSPPRGSRLFLRGNVADTLEQMGMLGLLKDAFSVSVEAAYERFIRDELKSTDTAEAVGDWLTRDVLPRLVQAHGAGRVRYLPHRKQSVDEPVPPEVVSLLTVVAAQIPGDAFVVCDDRYISSQVARDDSRPVVTSLDLIRELRLRGAISKDVEHDTVLQMRRLGLFYLAISAQELLYHLRAAPVADGIIVETEELSALRRYLAYALLDREALKPDSFSASGSVSQQRFLYESAKGIRGAIGDLVGDDDLVRADWIYSALAFDGLYGFNVQSLLPTDLGSQQTVDAEAASYLLGLLRQ